VVDSELPSINEFKKKKEPNHFHFEFSRLSQVIFQPGKAFSEIVNKPNNAGWITPILVISVLIILSSLLSTLGVTSNQSTSAPATTSSSSTTTTTPQTFGGMGGMGFPGTTTTPTTAADVTLSTSTTLLFSILKSLIGFLLTWLIIGGLANLLVVALGGQGHAKIAFNIAAWACVPIGVRFLMRIVYVIATGTAISQSGLSGFLANGSSNLDLILEGLLAQVDIYLFWQIGLLIAGLTLMSGISHNKSFLAVGIVIVIIMIAQALISFGAEKLSTLSLSTNFLNGLIR
jgi:hypothetical protein